MAESRFIPSSPPPFPPELRGSVRWVPWKGITEETISPSLFAVALPPGLRMLPGIWLLPTTDVKNMPWGMTFHHWIADMFRRCGCYVQLVPIFEADGRFADNISNSKRVRDIQRYYDGLQDGLLGLDVCEPEETGHYVYMTGNCKWSVRCGLAIVTDFLQCGTRCGPSSPSTSSQTDLRSTCSTGVSSNKTLSSGKTSGNGYTKTAEEEMEEKR